MTKKMTKQGELESSPLSSSPLSSPPESLDGFDTFDTYQSRPAAKSPTPKTNSRRRPLIVQKSKSQDKTEKIEEADEPAKTPTVPTPTRELVEKPPSPAQPKAVELEERVDGVNHDVSEPPNTTSSQTSARESRVQTPTIPEQPGVTEKEDKAEDKADGLGGSVGPEMASPGPPSERESQEGPTMLEQEAGGMEGVSPEPIKAESTAPATAKTTMPATTETTMPATTETATPGTAQGSVSEVHDTIIYGESAPKSPSPLADEKKATKSPLENETQSPTKRKASGQGGKQPATKNARRSAPGPPRKTAKQKKWESPFVLTDPKSPLGTADIRAMLLLPRAWDILNLEEKRGILAKFPDESYILNPGTDEARPDIEKLRNSDNFRHDCARYSENIREGRHDEEWLRQAWIAHEKHKRGDFDEYLEQKFVEDWGTPITDEYRKLRAKHSIASVMARKDSTAASVVSTGSASGAGSPVTKTTPENVRTMQKLTLENSPLPSEDGSAANLSPTIGTSMEGVVLSPGGEA